MYMIYSEYANPHRQRRANGCLMLELELEENEESLLMVIGSLWGNENIILTVMMTAQMSEYTKTTKLNTLMSQLYIVHITLSKKEGIC